MIDTNNIKCTLEDAWKEFEHSGEISNTRIAEGMILAVEALLKENEELKIGLFLHNKIKVYPEGTLGHNQAKQELDSILVKYKKEGVYYD